MPSFPSADALCLLSDALEFNIANNAERPFYVYAGGDSKINTITHVEFARACHRVAHTFRPNREGAEGEVVAIVAVTDTIMYQAIVVGLIVAGLVPFPISPRHSAAAVVNLLRKTSCHRLIITKNTLQPLMKDISSQMLVADGEFDISFEDIPPFDKIFPELGTKPAEDPFVRFPHPLQRPNVRDVCLYFHSSGSTGLPKPISCTHSTYLNWASFPLLTEFRDASPPHVIGSMALPSFHVMAFYTQILFPIYGLLPAAIYPPMAVSKESNPMVPSPDNLLYHMVQTRTTCMITVPTFLEAWSHSSKAVEKLRSFRVVAFSGGALAERLGDSLVSAGVNLRGFYGGTETGCPTHVLPLKGDEKEWAWMKFHDKVSVRWVPQADDTFECQLLTVDTHDPRVENLPDVRGFATSDIFVRHPKKPYLWKIVGRIDDVIIHSSGEKTVPAPIETIIMGSSIVQGAIMFGRERDLAGVLIEPTPGHVIDVDDAKQVAQFRNQLWPVIEEANKGCAAYSRIFKEMILIASSNKPLPRSGKGTVMRKAALLVYEPEIDLLYETVGSGTKGLQAPNDWTASEIERWLLVQAADIRPGIVLDAAIDIFEQGFDSLSVTFLRHRIVSALRSSDEERVRDVGINMKQDTIYSYPTISQLSMFIADLINQTETPNSVDKKSEIEEMVKKYTTGLDVVKGVEKRMLAETPIVVLLTGSTGNLGSQILAFLLDDCRVRKVFSLNRPSSSKSIVERHREKFVGNGFDSKLLESSKLVFIEGDTSTPNFGLAESIYTELLSSVTVVIHSAWRLDFNMSLKSFESSIRGTRNLVDFSHACVFASTLRFLFTSSVSSAQSWDRKQGPFPEDISSDVLVSAGNGYGESKYVAERILAESRLQATSFRIGQISGAPNGAWPTVEWFPILVKSSLKLGHFPDAKGVVSWTPMEVVSRTILDVAFARESPPIVLNVAHPYPTKWADVISAVMNALLQELHLTNTLSFLPFREWFSLLEERAKDINEQDLRDIPAIKLLDFFRAQAHADDGNDDETGGMSKFSTRKIQRISDTLKNARPLESIDAQRWVKYWNSVNFFD